MFDRITLGIKGDSNLIQTRLYNHPECVFPISVSKDEAEKTVTYIEFNPADDAFVLEQYVNVVAEYIIDRYETRLLRRILETTYKELSPIEKREILKSIEMVSDDSKIGYNARKQAVLLSVYDYLQDNKTMFLDGFVAFRLKNYEALLEQLASSLVEQHLAHKEYEEFVGLLKYFVNMQTPRPEKVHIFVSKRGGYRILDKEKNDITARCFADFLEGEVLLTEEAYDDLLISVLITLAPQKIVVHHKENIRNHELFTTISRVFDGEMEYCSGCPLCEKNK